MPKKAPELTVKQVEALKKPGLFAVGGMPGLHLQITDSGARSWVYRFQMLGRRRDMGIGPYDRITLKQARERARGAWEKIDQGVDPINERRAERQAKAAMAMTFRQCAEAYIEANRSGWRSPKSLAAWEGTLRDYAYPAFGNLNVADIDIPHVLKAIEPIWSTKTETANRLRGRIESVLAWATTRKYRKGDNPARWSGNLNTLLPKPSKIAKVEHHAALDYKRIGEFMAELRKTGGLAARCLEFTILTAARSGEAFGATWQEVDFKEHTWTVPGERMKNGREHVVPLSAPALALLETLPKGNPGDRLFRLSNMAMAMLLRRMGHGDLTVHGFRSTFRDWAGDRSRFPREIAEMALSHAVGDKVEAAYRRGTGFEKRRQLAEAWGGFVAVPSTSGDNVRPIRQSEAANG